MQKTMKSVAKVALLVSLCVPSLQADHNPMHIGDEPQKVGQRMEQINILGNWRVSIIEMDGAFIRVPEQAEAVTMQINNSQISGLSGCNNFMSSYTAIPNTPQITINEGASTRKMCHPEEVMRFEDAFLRLLVGTFMVEKNFEGITLVRDNVKIYLAR